jgi:K+-transporting ATPase ATPase A chain
MTANDALQIIIYFGVLLLLAKPLGIYMARIYEGEAFWPVRLMGGMERLFYRLCGVKAEEEMNWQRYALAVLLFSAASYFAVYLLQRLQGILPLNPQKFPSVSPDGGAIGAELCLCRNGNGGACCPDQRV